jgi:hypothetical protein
VALSFLYLAFVRTLRLVGLRRRDADDLAIEVVMLRHEVAVLRRQVVRPALRPADRAVLAGLARLLTRAKIGRFFVQPDTLLRWHRELVKKEVDIPEGVWSSEDPARQSGRGHQTGQGESDLGLPSDPRRALRHGHRPSCFECLEHPPAPRPRSLSRKEGPELGRVLEVPGHHHVGLRFIHGRHRAPEAAVRPFLHRTQPARATSQVF